MNIFIKVLNGHNSINSKSSINLVNNNNSSSNSNSNNNSSGGVHTYSRTTIAIPNCAVPYSKLLKDEHERDTTNTKLEFYPDDPLVSEESVRFIIDFLNKIHEYLIKYKKQYHLKDGIESINIKDILDHTLYLDNNNNNKHKNNNNNSNNNNNNNNNNNISSFSKIYINSNNNNNKNNNSFEQVPLSNSLQRDENGNFISFDSFSESGNGSGNGNGNGFNGGSGSGSGYVKLPAVSEHVKPKKQNTFKSLLYNHVNLFKHGKSVESLVATAEYFGVIENLLIRAIRHQIELVLFQSTSVENARSYFGITHDFDPLEEERIQKEHNFIQTSYASQEECQNENNYRSYIGENDHHITSSTTSSSSSNQQQQQQDSRNCSHIHNDDEDNNYDTDITQMIKPRRLIKPISDHFVVACHACNQQFSLSNRRSHLSNDHIFPVRCIAVSKIGCSIRISESVRTAITILPMTKTAKHWFLR
ncbi:hypothetical protein PPL_10340 [Heterostelium album PN500]|uniref:Uncharacterized protein n=1 Tax=Heterostelium pallidum (strain ATCC 26659 / Pp 5 / PN500) TaxID=670386 RepID=D3BQ20_HETP5|nr:hypothetical protein PPL_10340 [Heterostelium album PN500]EFA76571.1 hypothetical protein PPL_10340 [Heterostelium album PN500]|eukprot:XP_020428703.1 hypothetical protein PPL_10340 [Heterostelium album PN500]